MAVYRQIQIEYWRDGFVLDLTPEERYFYIYLLTNSKTLQCGIYELPTKIIEIETGYSKETIEKLINRFIEYNKISYDFETKEIFIKNWLKHNKIVNIKIQKCVEKEIKKIKSQILLKEFIEESQILGYDLYKDTDIPVGKSQNSEVEESQSTTNIKEFTKIYEENLGLINGASSQWLIETCNKIDLKLFKKSINIAKEKGKLNKGYINGIINQWHNNNISTLEELKAYEEKLNYRGENNYGANKNNQQSKYATELQNEDESIYQKPTREQIEHTRTLLTRI